MHDTHHMKQRMSQRGINREMVDFVLAHGQVEQDKVILGRKEARQLLKQLQEQMRVAKKLLDKGGMVVVTEGEALITTYNFDSHKH